MTLVEFFDENCIENVAGALFYAPETVKLFGHNRDRLRRSCERYNRLMRERGLNTYFEYVSVTRNDLSDIVDALSRVVEESEQCVFELTGGEDLYLVAAGVAAKAYGARVHLSRINLIEGLAKRMLPKGSTTLPLELELSAKENVLIYGGQMSLTEPWRFTETFCKDVDALWHICRHYPKWNATSATLALVQSRYLRGLTVKGNITSLPLNAVQRQNLLGLVSLLEQAGLVEAQSLSPQSLHFTYRSEHICRALNKAGQALELWVGAALSRRRDIFCDVLVGVALDWDEREGLFDVGNEIDVMAMRGTVPLFISCKNGKVDSDELYKLSLVASRFGGRYAKKALVVRRLDKNKSTAHLKARARDMDIELLEIEALGEQKVVDRLLKLT